METMFFPDEIRAPQALAGINEEAQFHQNELQMASTLISNLSADFAPEKYTNEYRRALLELIENKVAGREVVRAPQPEREKVIDLVEALRRSVELTSAGAAAAAGATAVAGAAPAGQTVQAADAAVAGVRGGAGPALTFAGEGRGLVAPGGPGPAAAPMPQRPPPP
jgi:hypothetical protein